MNPKRQCQRTEPHAQHEFVHCAVNDCHNIHHPSGGLMVDYQCEGVNFVEFKVGDKVKLEGVVTSVGKTYANFRANTNEKSLSFDFDYLELVERPEPPLPDWVVNPSQGTAVIAGKNIWAWDSNKDVWRDSTGYALDKYCSIRWYREGKIKRLVPEQ